MGPVLTRRAFVSAGGALIVSLSLPDPLEPLLSAQSPQTTLDPSRLQSWLEIHADGRVLVRTGRVEVGTGMSAFYTQMVAEELRVRPETISLVMGDTDATPDGGLSATLLSGATNLRKVAAYTYQALLSLASTELGASASSLSASDGAFHAGDRTLTYSQLVRGQQLELKISVRGNLPGIDPTQDTGIGGIGGLTVTGDPPMKAAADYSVIGRSFPMPGIPDKVTAKTKWSGDVRLPGMLHARMIRPATLGSTLISAAAIDRRQFPRAEVVSHGNLVAVVSPDEWEAVKAARAVAAQTKWTDWNGLPPSDTLTAALRAHPWGAPTATRGKPDAVSAAMKTAVKTLSASYEQPCTRHAPIGPFVAVADVQPNGIATIWTHSSNSQALRAQIAHTLDLPTDRVIVRWLDQSGQYGRTTWGGDGAEGDAAILSRLVGKPVRVQWTLEEDLAWSSLVPGWVGDVQIGLNDRKQIIAFQSDWYSPHHNDARVLGAMLAGLPAVSPKSTNGIWTIWPYDRIANVVERAYAMPNVGADAPLRVGLRGNIMRTPWQRQQNFMLETIVNEVAAAAGADPIEFRINHTSDERLIAVLRAAAEAARWDSRPSPAVGASSGTARTRAGHGVAVMLRSGVYWAGIADIEIVPSTGAIAVKHFVVATDVGMVINPRHLTRIVSGGVVMGVGEALSEEVSFNSRKVTSTDWTRYRIPTMNDAPEIQVIQISRPGRGFGTGGEAPNGLVPPAVVAAFFDATGVQPRRIPLTPQVVLKLLA